MFIGLLLPSLADAPKGSKVADIRAAAAVIVRVEVFNVMILPSGRFEVSVALRVRTRPCVGQSILAVRLGFV
jgi:hypothetical protein